MLVAFLIAAPIRVGPHLLGRLTAVLGLCAAAVIGALAVNRTWRSALSACILTHEHHISRVGVLAATAAAALAILRLLVNRFLALEVNAWDFSVFEWPIVQTVRGAPLYSPFTGRSFLGTHASYALFALTPLYAIVLSPYWLLICQACAVACAAALYWRLARDLGGGDATAAAILALAFLLNSYTAKITQYAFHVEVFYLPAIFLTLLGAVRKSAVLFGLGVGGLLSIKEDSVLPLLGLALALGLRRRQWWFAAVAVGAGVFGFLVSQFVVIPIAAGSAAGHPWYSSIWSSYGPTPLQAAAGMATRPLQLLGDVAESGTRHVLETLLFLPVLGYEWSIAALPGVFTYSAAEPGQLKNLSLYYSAPVLPFLFAAIPAAASRLSNLAWHGANELTRRRRYRLVCLAVLVVSAFDGASYRFEPRRAQQGDVTRMVSRVPPRMPLMVQGSLFPHAGYEARLRALDGLRKPRGTEAYLLDPRTEPYPLSNDQLSRLIVSLRTDQRYRTEVSPHGLLLFVPPGTGGTRMPLGTRVGAKPVGQREEGDGRP